MNLSRTQMLVGVGVLAAAALAIAAYFYPVGKGTITTVGNQVQVDTAVLHQAGPLGDKVLGAANAPVTIVEYASVTCGACAAFHLQTYPTLKKKYIDAGKVRLIMREFPTQPAQVSVAGFMLARCAGDLYFPVLDTLFEQQQAWSADPHAGFLRIARQAGFTQERFDACLNDQKLAQQIQEVAKRGHEQFGVQATPTFFVNGRRYVGVLSVAELEKILAGLLPAS